MIKAYFGILRSRPNLTADSEISSVDLRFLGKTRAKFLCQDCNRSIAERRFVQACERSARLSYYWNRIRCGFG